MKFRWKLLALMLAISLGPILLMRVLGVRSIEQFRQTMVSRTAEHLVAETRDRLQLTVDAYSLVLWKSRRQVEMALLAQCERVERLLAQRPDASGPLGAAGSSHANESLPSSFHYREGRNGGLQFLKVSYETQAFHTAPGVSPEVVGEDAARLQPLVEIYRPLARRLPETILWQSVNLENGLVSIYPATTSLPRGYDPRGRDWYRTLIASTEIRWSAPFVDPATRQVVMAAGRGVRRPDGAVAGVSAIFVPVGRLVDHELLVKNLPPESRGFLCFLPLGTSAENPEVFILARDEAGDRRGRSWRAVIEPQRLYSEDTDSFDAMLEDVMNGRGNIRRMRFDDCDCLWVYGAESERSFFLLIMPYEKIIEPVRQVEAEVIRNVDNVIRSTQYLLGVILVLIVLMALAFSRQVTRPVWSLVNAARQLADGNFDARVDIRSRDEFGVMGEVFNRVGPELKEKRILRQSLEMAREIQHSLLPGGNPNVPGFDIAARCIYCDETGGDYYDYLESAPADRRAFAIVVGDIAGHGIPAALLMTTARAFLRQRAALPGTPVQVLADTNAALCRDVEDSGQFLTLAYAEVDPEEGALGWIRAGHEPGLLYLPKEDRFEQLGGQGMPLGIFPEAAFEMRRYRLQSGQICLMITDGIPETFDPAGHMYGRRRLQAVVRANAHLPAETLAAAIIADVAAFRGARKQEDDLTLVVFKVL
ncbi:MAG TPA: SpoIIE family protein phosphatase [Desulfobacterales bacterium]